MKEFVKNTCVLPGNGSSVVFSECNRLLSYTTILYLIL